MSPPNLEVSRGDSTITTLPSVERQIKSESADLLLSISNITLTYGKD